MAVHNLLIMYYPGARGDFLASLILNQLANQIMQGAFSTPLNYKKVHEFDNEETFSCSINDLINSTSIRIKLSSFNDILTVTYFCIKKINFETRTANLIFSSILAHEIKHKKLDPFFNYILEFQKLFDIEYLKTFYKTITSGILTPGDVMHLTQNLEKNPRIDLNNYSDYIDIDIDKAKREYEQAFGISIN